MYKLAIVIDDDPISILVCETLLRKTNFAGEVRSFKSAEEGIAYLDAHFKAGNGLPDTIFLDLLMPVMNGWEFLEAYADLPSLPEQKAHIIMLSAAFDPGDRTKAEASPLVIDFISKPITKEVLTRLAEGQ